MDLNALRRAQTSGVEVIVVTGRRHMFAMPIVEQLGFDLWVISSNGAVTRSMTGETFHRDMLPAATCRSLCQHMMDFRGNTVLTFDKETKGAVVLERITGPHETPMITAYYLNGDKLQLTHYCELGNQPHMIAKNIDLDRGEIAFEFASAGNLASLAAEHMHSATLRLVDNDHFTADWTLFDNAKPNLTMDLHYVRVK